MNTLKGLKVRVFSPAYNVERFLPRSLVQWELLHSLMASQGADLQVCIFDDASTDDTPKILEEFSSKNSWMMHHRHILNQGNANNIIHGYAWAIKESADVVGCMDADREHNPLAVIPHITEYLYPVTQGCRGYDGVVGTIPFPQHQPGAIDRLFMQHTGSMQAAQMGAEEPFLIQSGGYQLHRLDTGHVQKSIKLLKGYHQKFAEFQPMMEFPRWGMHGLLNHLMSWDEESMDATNPLPSTIRLKSAYLECFGLSPNRSPEKLLAQSKAAQAHLATLAHFYPIKTSDFHGKVC